MYDVQMADKGTTNMFEPYSDGSVMLRGSFAGVVCSNLSP